MKHARIVHQGREQTATERDGRLLLEDGRSLVGFDQVQWLPPLVPTPARPRTILALEHLDADRAQAAEPVVFIKGQGSLVGHRAHSRRPVGVQRMQPGCTLVVVIGRQARRVQQADARGFISGYTVANDYVMVDYLENWCRPNLRATSRDTCTPIGPWLVDADDVPDLRALTLRTEIDGRTGRSTHSGHTRDMRFDPFFLIACLSDFMTLEPGDLILTGTPDVAADCRDGDRVVCTIEGIGALANTIRQS